ncbi:phage tail protein [[Phormidium ambiguum] IAM M-71]|uniref:Phage tail protein n=1 Tax=[Phormidium ambiguum] IAM M-71 TaxID=454136 RepID=A0A1U7IQN7_9CYAN|nr:phage tail sheath C-terminal domain-containing protein [Phormidium ambiguum]OKH39730.1 phage tail protein [Phormidium ambiguum IAM M-71]
MARLDYFAPGVYIEEVDRGSRPIEGVPTAVAGFLGFTEDIRGGAEIFKPMLVTTWSQYLQYFGRPNSDGYTDFGAYLPFSVYGWFLNGGGRCWVMSIGTRLPGSSAPEPTAVGTDVNNRTKRPALRFALRQEGALAASGNGNGALATTGDRTIRVRIMEGEPKPQPASDDGTTTIAVNTGEYFTVVVSQSGEELERFPHLTMNPEVNTEVADYVVTALEESRYLQATDISLSGSPLSRRPNNGVFEVSPPPMLVQPERFNQYVEGVRDDRTGVRGLFEVDDITIVSCPDLMRVYEAGLMDLDQVHGVMDMMLSMCEGASAGDIPNPPNRMVIIDPPPDRVRPQDVSRWVSEDFNRRSQFAALYYPWIQVPNPRNAGRPISIPPSGYMAGVWSRIDETRGVYKAPANEVPRGVVGLAYDCNFREQELLNPIGINCIRTFPNRGIRIWGARTLVEPDNTQWRYISVRRLMSYIEKSIELGTQWVVFEPNDEDLWQRVKRTIGNFLNTLWREGALTGSSPDQAYYIKCDEEINTPQTMLLGRLYVEVGVAPVRPAEFVIFRISQMTGDENEE